MLLEGGEKPNVYVHMVGAVSLSSLGVVVRLACYFRALLRCADAFMSRSFVYVCSSNSVVRANRLTNENTSQPVAGRQRINALLSVWTLWTSNLTLLKGRDSGLLCVCVCVCVCVQEYCEESHVPFMSVLIDTSGLQAPAGTQKAPPLHPFHD